MVDEKYSAKDSNVMTESEAPSQVSEVKVLTFAQVLSPFSCLDAI